MAEEPKIQPEKAEESKETEDGGVEVSLQDEREDKDDEVSVEDEPITPKVEHHPPKHPPVDDRKLNQLYAERRIISKLQREIEELKAATVKPQQHENVAEDDLDKLAEKDWKQAVRKLAFEEAQKIYQSQQEAIRKQSEYDMIRIQQEENAKSVVAKHPEVEDPSSEKSQIFQDILAKNPRWVQSPDGPLLTMYRMEEELRRRGYDIDNVGQKIEEERSRLNRVSVSSIPSSRPVTSDSNKIVLTREQREFCDANGMSYADYARTLKNRREGVEL